MGTHTESVKEFVKELRKKQTGYVLFTEDPNDDADAPLEFSNTRPKPGKGQVVGAVQIDGERIYVVGKKFNDTRMKAIRKAVKEAIGNKVWLMTQAEAIAGGFVLDPTLASVDDEDSESEAEYDSDDDAADEGPLPPLPDAQPAPRAARGNDDDDDNDNDDDDDGPRSGKEKLTAAEAADPALAKLASRVELVLPKWPAVRTILAQHDQPTDVQRKIEAVDRLLGLGSVGKIIRQTGARAQQAMEMALGAFMELAALAKAAGAAPAAAPASEYERVVLEPEGGAATSSSATSPYAAARDVLAGQGARYEEMLTNWGKLFNRFASIAVNDAVNRDIATVESIIRPGSSVLTLEEIKQKHADKAVELMERALDLYNRLSAWYDQNPLLSGEELTEQRAIGLRIAKFLPIWPTLLDQLERTEPDSGTQADMDRLDAIFRNGGSKCLSVDEIVAMQGNKATAVLKEAEDLFVKLGKLARANAAALSGSGSSTGGSDYAELPGGGSEAPPAGQAASSSEGQYAKMPGEAFAVPEGYKEASILKAEWKDIQANYLYKLIQSGRLKKEAIHAAKIEIDGLLDAGDPASLARADKMIDYYRARKADMLKALEALKEPAAKR